MCVKCHFVQASMCSQVRVSCVHIIRIQLTAFTLYNLPLMWHLQSKSEFCQNISSDHHRNHISPRLPPDVSDGCNPLICPVISTLSLVRDTSTIQKVYFNGVSHLIHCKCIVAWKLSWLLCYAVWLCQHWLVQKITGWLSCAKLWFKKT